jgi:hypothetical protein
MCSSRRLRKTQLSPKKKLFAALGVSSRLLPTIRCLRPKACFPWVGRPEKHACVRLWHHATRFTVLPRFIFERGASNADIRISSGSIPSFGYAPTTAATQGWVHSMAPYGKGNGKPWSARSAMGHSAHAGNKEETGAEGVQLGVRTGASRLPVRCSAVTLPSMSLRAVRCLSHCKRQAECTLCRGTGAGKLGG